MAIYTRKGDRGKTSLFDGKKVYKSDRKVDAYGSLDELNSSIGLAMSFIRINSINKELEEVQNDLFEIGAALATTTTQPVPQLKERPEDFEKLIDILTSKMPELKEFILPGGGKAGSALHLARTIARRAERNIVELSRKEKIDPMIIIYLNRLSDLLFTMARFVNFKESGRRPGESLAHREKKWRKK